MAANLATAIVVLVCSKMGLPISTSHAIVCAILGIGLARGLGSVSKAIMRDILGSWFITVPASAVLSLLLFLLGRAFLLESLARQVAMRAG